MMQTPQMTDHSIETAILAALRQGGRNRGELSDLTGQTYSRLVPALDGLLRKKLIDSYFQSQEEHLPVLTYRLRSPSLPKRQAPPPPPPLNPLLRQSRP